MHDLLFFIYAASQLKLERCVLTLKKELRRFSMMDSISPKPKIPPSYFFAATKKNWSAGIFRRNFRKKFLFSPATKVLKIKNIFSSFQCFRFFWGRDESCRKVDESEEGELKKAITARKKVPDDLWSKWQTVEFVHCHILYLNVSLPALALFLPLHFHISGP